MNYTEEITNYYARLEKTIESLDKEALNQVMNLLQDAYKKESRIYVCGKIGRAHV